MVEHSAAFALALLVAACATADFTPSESGQRFPAWAGNVAVLDQMPDSGFQRVGGVVDKGGLAHDTNELTRALKERAAEAVGNAIVIVQERTFHGANVLAIQPVVDMSAVAIRLDRP
jgi:hypothetical protein